ncbi:hypothetical protein KKA17_05860 [bacterium]|nr:hypothetical protein [bacterium]MBU1884930.1 hypothetical protein [bacterium]
MKKILLSLTFAATSLLAFCDTQAGQTCNNQSELFISNQSIVNEVVVDTPKTDLITSTTNKFSASVQAIHSDDFNMFNLPLGANIGSHFGAEVNVPYISKKDQVTGDTNSGIGDVSAGGNFHFGAMSEGSGLNITTLLYKTTTGGSNKGLGSDKPAYTLSHKFSKYMIKEIEGNAIFSYTFNDTSVSGNSYLAALGGSMPCLLYNKIHTNAKISYFHIDKVGDGFLLPEVKSADLWIGWDLKQITANIPVSFGLKVPLLNEVGGVDADKKFLFYLSMTGLY